MALQQRLVWMDTFEHVWEASRTNSWSWGYSTTLWVAVAVLAALSLVRKVWLRRTAMVIAIITLSFIATEFSERTIVEKWQIRRDWADAHGELMTTADWNALSVDGANIVFGPLIDGLQAVLVLVVVSFAIFQVRKFLERE